MHKVLQKVLARFLVPSVNDFPAQKTGRGRTTPSQAAPILSSFGKFLDALHRKHWCFPHLMSLLTMFKPPPTNVSVILHASPLILLLLPSTLLPCPSSPSQTCIFHPHSNSVGMTFEISHPSPCWLGLPSHLWVLLNPCCTVQLANARSVAKPKTPLPRGDN